MDAVAAATATVPRLYPLGSVPATPTYPYGVYSASLGLAAHYTLDSRHHSRTVNVVVQTFGRTADSALTLADRVTDALLDVALTIPGYGCNPLRNSLNPTATRDPDDSGVVGFTQALSAQATKET